MSHNRPEPTINIPLLRKTLEHITDHPSEHDQTTWAVRDPDCGTVCCFAGWTVLLSGHELTFDRHFINYAYIVADGRTIAEAAQEELGLDDQQAWDMFYGAGTAGQLWTLAEEFTAREIVRPAAAGSPDVPAGGAA